MTKPEAHVTPAATVDEIRGMISDLTVSVSYMDHPAWSASDKTAASYRDEALTLVSDLTAKLADLRNSLEGQW
jgi:hypothetical protein